jgi:hypothetical protein
VEPSWLELPAISQLTLTTANLMEHCSEATNPFKLPHRSTTRVSWNGPVLYRAATVLRALSRTWELGLAVVAMPRCGAPIDSFITYTNQPMFKTLRRAVTNLAHAIEIKRLRADGVEPASRAMRGLTIPRPVHVKLIEHIGKEVIVDPIEIDEDLTATQRVRSGAVQKPGRRPRCVAHRSPRKWRCKDCL